MAVSVYSYTIYHSPNAYLGTALLRRAVAELPGVEPGAAADLRAA
jgi:hypothetical protein